MKLSLVSRDIIYIIFSNLQPIQIFGLSSINKYFFKCIHSTSQHFWKKTYELQWFKKESEPIPCWKTKTLKRLLFEHTFYEHMYNYIILNDGCVVTALAMKEEIIISGSNDIDIKVLDCTSGKLISFLKGHQKKISGLVWDHQNILISGSHDTTIRLWNVEEKIPLTVLKSHSDFVESVSLVNQNTFLSGSSDLTIKGWDIDTGKCIYTLFGHTYPVWHLSVNETNCLSGGGDNVVKLWDLRNRECIKNIPLYSATRFGTYGIFLDRERIFAVTETLNAKCGQIQEWSVKTFKKMSELKIKEWYFKAFIVDGNLLFYAGNEKLYILNPKNMINFYLNEHWSYIETLLVTDQKILSADANGKIIVRDKPTLI